MLIFISRFLDSPACQQNSELEARLEYTMQMKQDELSALRKLEAESTQLESEAADLASRTEAAKRGFLQKYVLRNQLSDKTETSIVNSHSWILHFIHRMQSALAERRTMLNLPAMTDLGESSIDPDASKMKAISKELATAFQKVPLNGRLAIYSTFLAEVDKFST